MLLHVLNAHTGQIYTADSDQLKAIDTFKTWLAQASGIAVAHQILLTQSGKQVKLQSLQDGAEIFLYNRQFLSPSSNTCARRLSIRLSPTFHTLEPFPSFAEDVVQPIDSEEWRSLFRARQEWAQDVQTKAAAATSELADEQNAAAIILRGTEVALGNLQAHVASLDQKYQEASAWASNLLSQQDKAIEDARIVIESLRVLPAKTALFRYLPRLSEPASTTQDEDSTLAHLASIKDFQRKESILQKSQEALRSQLRALEAAAGDVMQETDRIVQAIDEAESAQNKRNTTNTEQIEEIQALADKITSDSVHVDELIEEGRLAGQAARIASLQIKNYLPAIIQSYHEIVDALKIAVSQRDDVAQLALRNMQRIARTEASFASANASITDLDLLRDAAEALEAISVLSDLPRSYGILLVECVHRQEWSDKLRTESGILAEDMAGRRELEIKRRRKWLKVNNYLLAEAPPSDASDIELKLQHVADELPGATRADLLAYQEAVGKCPQLSAVSDNLSVAAKDLDKPTKRSKQAPGFKSASIYEANSTRSSSFLRDSDEMSALQQTNLKLEEKIKAQKSRVRKLEQLVFTQTQSHRSSSSNLFQIPGSQRPDSPVDMPDPTLSPMASPKTNVELLSRKASVNSRRASGVQSQDEKTLARRIVTLEAELYEVSQRNQSLEKEKQQVQNDGEQARLTSNDLLANMDAQQREFADERRMLREEAADWKRKFEETEDELERIIGIRENDRMESDERSRDASTHISELEAKLRRHQEETRDHRAALQGIHRNMQGNAAVDTETTSNYSLGQLIHTLTRVCEQASLQKLRLQEAVEDAKAENEKLQDAIEQKDLEHEKMTTKQLSLRQDRSKLEADLSAREARLTTLQFELEDGRSQLRELRAKFAEGETGAVVLRQRVEDQAAKVTQAATDLAAAQSEVEHLKIELKNSGSTQTDLQHEGSLLTQRLASRSEKDVELSYRLANYVRELSRLLEALGLSVLEREDGTMTIQRTSKLTSTSQTLSDVSNPASASPLGRPYDLSIPQELLQWPQMSSLAEEDQAFGAFLSRLDALDLPALSDSILKLRRDVEWTGKKWKAEARSYRDKLHMVSSDSNHKIAFRGFKEGDLALFLPTRNQAMRPWAAFNVGAPHYFLRETESHQLQSREWLVARIQRIQERVVDLSGKNSATNTNTAADTRSLRSVASSSAISFEDDNPFDLSDGLRWYLIDAVEEKPGSASLPSVSSASGPANTTRHLRTASNVHGKGTPTISTACIDATGTSVKTSKGKLGDASTKLGQNLDSRRSSTTSRAGSVRATKDGASDVSVKVDTPREGGKKGSMVNVTSLARGLLGAEASTKSRQDIDADVDAGPGPGAGEGGSGGGRIDESQAQRRPDQPVPSSPPAHAPPPIRRTISQSVKPTSTSAFFTQQSASTTHMPPSSQKTTEGGETKRWRSLWSLDVNIEEDGGRKG